MFKCSLKTASSMYIIRLFVAFNHQFINTYIVVSCFKQSLYLHISLYPVVDETLYMCTYNTHTHTYRGRERRRRRNAHTYLYAFSRVVFSKSLYVLSTSYLYMCIVQSHTVL